MRFLDFTNIDPVKAQVGNQKCSFDQRIEQTVTTKKIYSTKNGTKMPCVDNSSAASLEVSVDVCDVECT